MATQTAHARFDPKPVCIEALDAAYSAHYEKVVDMAQGKESDLVSDIEPITQACGAPIYKATTKSINQLLFGEVQAFEGDELCIYDLYRAYSYQMYNTLEAQGADFEELKKEDLLEVLLNSKNCDQKIKDTFLSKIKGS